MASLMIIKFINGPRNGQELEVPDYMPSQIIFPSTLGTQYIYDLNDEKNAYLYTGEKELEEQK